MNSERETPSYQRHQSPALSIKINNKGFGDLS